MTYQKRNIFGLQIADFEEICFEEGYAKYTAKQLANWIYKKHVFDFQDMSNLSLKQREQLSEKYEISGNISVHNSVSTDGTVKHLFSFDNNRYAEAVYIPENERNTVCISTQTGCQLACKYCQTAKTIGCTNLETGEIISQIYHIPNREKITNIVIMGMGEPFMNWENVKNAIHILTNENYYGMSKKRITLSTVGVVEPLRDFLQHFPCELAVSLHNPFSEERASIMPIEKKYPIKEIVQMIRRYTAGSSRVVSFEYIVFKDFNHSKRHVDEISQLLDGIPCKINLMSYHATSDRILQKANYNEMEVFQNNLKSKGFTVTIRKSRGLDIEAACGMLHAKQSKTNE
jgi:23S rRNA (adenine2503-C2)-methyltransferase